MGSGVGRSQLSRRTPTVNTLESASYENRPRSLPEVPVTDHSEGIGFIGTREIFSVAAFATHIASLARCASHLSG